WLINLGRGALVDELALIGALRDGVIGGAALDVFELEPLPAASPLWTLPNVIVSPHMSGDFRGWEQAVVELFLRQLARYRDGQPLANVVDKNLGFVTARRNRPAQARRRSAVDSWTRSSRGVIPPVLIGTMSIGQLDSATRQSWVAWNAM